MLSILMTIFKVMVIIAVIAFVFAAICSFVGIKNESPILKRIGNAAVSISALGLVVGGPLWLITWILSLIF